MPCPVILAVLVLCTSSPIHDLIWQQQQAPFYTHRLHAFTGTSTKVSAQAWVVRTSSQSKLTAACWKTDCAKTGCRTRCTASLGLHTKPSV